MSKNCIYCEHKFGTSEFIEHFIQLRDNRVYCSSCQQKNYIIGASANTGFRVLKSFANFLWLPLAITAFLIFHSSAKTPGNTVISVGHFSFAFLGAMLGIGISKVIKQWLRWHFGHTANEDLYGDYEI